MLCFLFIAKSDLNLVKQVIKGAKNEQNNNKRIIIGMIILLVFALIALLGINFL